LIDDPEIAGEKAFNWEQEFPQVFAKGGFDVVIGNPPYVVYIKSLIGDKTLSYIFEKFDFAEYNPNTYSLFTELAISKLLKKDSGYLGFIIPNSWLSAKYFSKMRAGIYTKNVFEIINLKNTAFAEIVETVILLLGNNNYSNQPIRLVDDLSTDNHIFFNQIEKLIAGLNLFIEKSNSIIEKIDAVSGTIGENAIVYRGLETRDNKKYISQQKKAESFQPILLGKDINRYDIDYSGSYVNFIKSEMKSNANEDYYKKPKILMRRTGSTIIAAMDNDEFFALKNLYLIIPHDSSLIYSLLAQLNSSLLGYYHFMKSSGENKAFAQFQGIYVSALPFIKNDNLNFEVNINKIQNFVKNHKMLIEKFQRTITRKFEIDNLSKKLQEWYNLSYPEFIKELAKQKIKLSLSEEAEWEDYFNQEKAKAQHLQAEIKKTDKEIDQMVYDLYGLSGEEIEVIES